MKAPLHRNLWLWAFLIGIVTITGIRPLLRRVPDPPPVLLQLPDYLLVDEDGGPFGSANLAGEVYVANFFFTRCTSICPALTRSMASLQQRYSEAGVEEVQLVSISVDPDYDTPERLREYGALHGVDPETWTFLTGDTDEIRALAEAGFREAAIDIVQSGKLLLVDREGAIRGYYDSDTDGLDEVFHRSRHVLDERR